MKQIIIQVLVTISNLLQNYSGCIRRLGTYLLALKMQPLIIIIALSCQRLPLDSYAAAYLFPSVL